MGKGLPGDELRLSARASSRAGLYAKVARGKATFSFGRAASSTRRRLNASG
jgi:hypothetical protein